MRESSDLFFTVTGEAARKIPDTVIAATLTMIFGKLCEITPTPSIKAPIMRIAQVGVPATR
ncbi:MAG: hypothetical protein ABF384_06675 [Verrucomicrobiales bacterium]